MPHNDYAFRDEHGLTGAGTVPEPSILRQLDLAASQGIDGDNGGTWSPASPIIVGLAGVAISGWGQITGGVTTGPNAAPRALITAIDTPALWIGGARSRTVVFPLRDFGARFDETTYLQPTVVAYDEGTLPGAVVATNTSLSTIANAWVSVANTVRIIVPLPGHKLSMGGTTAGSFVPTLRLRIGKAAAPFGLTSMPGFRLSRIGSSGVWTNSYDIVIPTWQAAHAYNAGDLVIPTTPNGRQFRCTVAGTSGAAQPAAFGTAATGDTVLDGAGALAWRDEAGPAGATAHYITLPLPATAATYYDQGQWQDITLPGNMTPAGSSFFMAGVGGQAGSAFVIDILDKTGTNNVYHSLRLAMTPASFATAV